MAIVSLLDVSLSFGGAPLLDKVNLQIDRGERVCLLGRNGAGKSTLMKVITGELNADVGQVFRQSGAVFSSLRQEVPAGLTGTVRTVVEGEGGAYEVHNDWERHDRVERLLEGMGLPVDHEFAALSAGQKRRVLLARGLVEEPQLLLLDEPLGALDKKLRQRTQFELVNILESVGVTCVMVTHDQDEAMAMATRIAVMSQGRVLQVGTPKEIYEYPNCRFVADFIGNVNLWEGSLEVDAVDRCEVKTAHGMVRVGHGISGTQGMACAVAIRPEKITISKDRPAVSANLFTGTVKEIAYFGSYITFMVEVPGGSSVKILEANTSRYDSTGVTWNDAVFFWFDATAPVVLTQ